MSEQPSKSSKAKSRAKDIVVAASMGLASQVPIFGGPVVEIISTVISWRRDEWLEEITKQLELLEQQVDGFKIENLSQNPSFTTTLLHATQIAIRNHQEEKIEALRNAVLNAALPNALEDDIQLMFLNYVDTLTTWHIKILNFFNLPDWPRNVKFNRNPTGDEAINGRISISALEPLFFELSNVVDWQQQLIHDLFNRGLLSLVNADLWGGGIILSLQLSEEEAITTEIGRQFLVFISSPLPPDDEAKSL